MELGTRQAEHGGGSKGTNDRSRPPAWPLHWLERGVLLRQRPPASGRRDRETDCERPGEGRRALCNLHRRLQPEGGGDRRLGRELGTFAGGFFGGWIQARQAAGADRGETAKLLLAWMDDDGYGFCNDLGRDAVKVLDRAGLASQRSRPGRQALHNGENPSAHFAAFAFNQTTGEDRRVVALSGKSSTISFAVGWMESTGKIQKIHTCYGRACRKRSRPDAGHVLSVRPGCGCGLDFDMIRLYLG
jgi:hypothetical protein